MGERTFLHREHRRSMVNDTTTAFASAVIDANAEFGDDGYTGTIAEKSDFVVIGKAGTWEDAEAIAAGLLAAGDPRTTDKWGPCGCIETPDGFLFYGWSPT